MTADRVKALEDALKVGIALIEGDATGVEWKKGCRAFIKTARAALAASQPAPQVRPGAPITLTYTNWKGETAQRTIIPRRVWWGSTEWHPEPQWLLTAFDVDKGAQRDFALKDFGQPAQPVAVTPPDLEPVAWRHRYTIPADDGTRIEQWGFSVTQMWPDDLPLYPAPQRPAVQDAARVPEIAALIEAAKLVHDSHWYSADGVVTGLYDLAAALRAIAEGRA